MHIRIDRPQYQAAVLLRRAGYAPFRDPRTGKESFVRRLGAGFYPRFHLYVTKDTDETAEWQLHLDQRKPSYAGSRAHAGEYDGPLVEEEKQRILDRVAAAN
jgi:hypothetical protein